MNKFFMIANFSVAIWFGVLCVVTHVTPFSMIPNMAIGLFFAYKTYKT